MAEGRDSPLETYIYDLPYSVTRALTISLDTDRSAWEQLASEAGYSFEKLKQLELELHRYNGSPARALLWDLGSKNITAKVLYSKLKKINRIREITILDNHFASVIPEGKKLSYEETEEHIDNKQTTLPTPSLPRPSQKSKPKQESIMFKDNDEVNFNQPSPQNKNKQPVHRSISFVEKHYDDKIIPGQEKSSTSIHSYKDYFKNKQQPASGNKIPETKSNIFSSSSNPTESSDIDFSSLSKFSSTDIKSLQSALNSNSLNLALVLMGTPSFSFEELSKSTNGFSDQNKIGEGAFGKVYVCTLRGSKCAIKKLNPEEDASKEKSQQQLSCELSSLLRYRHENIVTLYGYAIDGPSLCLCYQHMINGSLEDCLMCRNGKTPLGWEQRLRILHGASNGLRYLHNMGDIPLIHGDIKSANILLDKHYEAKIGDLGQAQHVNSGAVTGKLTHITRKDAGSKLYGTKAYLPPELLRGNENLSIKTDVYAFGVVLLETCSGQAACNENRRTNKFLADYFMDAVEPLSQNEWVEEFRDKKAGKPPTDLVFNILKLAVSCISHLKKRRPDSNQVAEVLDKTYQQWNQNYASLQTEQCYSDINMGVTIPTHNIPENITIKQRIGGKSCTSHNIGQEQERSYSPIDYFRNEHQSLPEPFRLQMLYDQHSLEGGVSPEILQQIEQLRLQQQEEPKVYESDPKKLKELEESDTSEPALTDNDEQNLACDPKKLAQLKMFDAGGLIHEQNIESDSDSQKLSDILEFDKQNFKNSDQILSEFQTSEPTEISFGDSESISLKERMDSFFKTYVEDCDVDDGEPQ